MKYEEGEYLAAICWKFTRHDLKKTRKIYEQYVQKGKLAELDPVVEEFEQIGYRLDTNAN